MSADDSSHVELAHMPNLDHWLRHFQNNTLEVESQPGELSDEEYADIASSVAAFQLGEYSEGHSLMKFAKAYAQVEDAKALVEITRLFVREEQNHALLLKDFMEASGIPTIKRTFTDTVFRKLRKHVGYEISITVLITAETIALTYYRALKQATQHSHLKAICNKILADEEAHVRYESSLIRFIRHRHSKLRRWTTISAHRFLMFGTALVVWREHRSVFKRGGYGFTSFWRSNWKYLREAGL